MEEVDLYFDEDGELIGIEDEYGDFYVLYDAEEDE